MNPDNPYPSSGVPPAGRPRGCHEWGQEIARAFVAGATDGPPIRAKASVSLWAKCRMASPCVVGCCCRDLIDPVCQRGYCSRRVGGILDRFTTYEDLGGSIPTSARWVIPAPAPTRSGAGGPRWGAGAAASPLCSPLSAGPAAGAHLCSISVDLPALPRPDAHPCLHQRHEYRAADSASPRQTDPAAAHRPRARPPLWEVAAACTAAGNDPHWELATQPLPEIEFDQRLAW